ncbi:hypothetical protein SAMN06296036_116144 [Pseudobacteriovorax antillogorgiicola]|uniref:Uncharacterized protein n=1 Tax=Pseudobacteriovorax antillogorgiicola TaxID=1513793 RepID=A0A1Y6CAN9_9BACT|nr:hypothetical protein EDD56_11610 [Pseudobacteriovorax antillogorgiicola]SMF53629.1 hypothetical protein SAMN06296036_116144 [Pseudobacteriovorax antillogorgiicola]
MALFHSLGGQNVLKFHALGIVCHCQVFDPWSIFRVYLVWAK